MFTEAAVKTSLNYFKKKHFRYSRNCKIVLPNVLMLKTILSKKLKWIDNLQMGTVHIIMSKYQNGTDPLWIGWSSSNVLELEKPQPIFSDIYLLYQRCYVS